MIGFTDALNMWRLALHDSVRSDVADLSARQMAVLLEVYIEEPPHRVRDLARKLNISKPAITRSLDRLAAAGFLRRKPDESDARSIVIQRTVKGSVFLREFGESVQSALEHAMAQAQKKDNAS